MRVSNWFVDTWAITNNSAEDEGFVPRKNIMEWVLKLLIEVETYQFSIEGVAHLSPTTADCMQVLSSKN